MKKIRVGVVGVGYLGRFHAEKYAALPDVELVGVVDADAGRTSELAGRLKTGAFTDPAELFGRVDAVSIVVPTIFHYGVAKQFLEQKVHVLLEKPMTVTLEQADELIELATRGGAVFQIGHIERFNPALAALKAAIKRPRYMTSERAAPFTVRCTDVNVVLDLMIHDLDIVADLADSEPRELSAAGASVITGEIDAATVRIVFQNGCVADVAASRVSDEKKRLLRVFDGGNVYTADYQAQTAVESCNGGALNPGLTARDISRERQDTLREEICAFIRCIQTGSRPMVSGREGRRALALAGMITECIASGTTGFVPVK